jgi:hypothetical protein
MIALNKRALAGSLAVVLASMLVWLGAAFSIVKFFEESKDFALPQATLLVLKFYWVFVLIFVASIASATAIFKSNSRRNFWFVLFAFLTAIFIALASFCLIASVLPMVSL